MIDTGEVKNGAIVLKNAPKFEDGTEVRVEIVESKSKPPRGSAKAILRHAGGWAESGDEMDKSLGELRQMKWEEVRLQQSRPEESL